MARGTNNNTNVPDEAFSDELLKTSCERCSTILRLNPFVCEQPTNLHWSGGTRHALPTEIDVDSGDEDDSIVGAKFGPILRTRRKQGPLEFNIVSFQETKQEAFSGIEHQVHQKKMKIKMTRPNVKGKTRKSSSNRTGSRSVNVGVNAEDSAIGDSIFVKDGDSAFDM